MGFMPIVSAKQYRIYAYMKMYQSHQIKSVLVILLYLIDQV